MLNAEQARARPYSGELPFEHDEPFHDFATLYALRLSRSLTDIANAVDDRWELARHLLPLLGVKTPLQRGTISRIAALLDRVVPPTPRRTGPSFTNIDCLASVLRLNRVETGLLDLAIVIAHHGELADAFERIAPRSRFNAARMLSWTLDCDPVDALRATSASAILVRLGFLTPFEPRYRLDSVVDLPSDVLLPLIESYPVGQTILDTFSRTSLPTPLGPDSFPHLAEDVGWVLPFLRKAVADRTIGVNVLLHGPPGTGKTEFARMLAQTLNCTLAEVRFDDHEGLEEDAKGRMRSNSLIQAIYQRHGSALVLFDDADDVFAGASAMGGVGHKVYGKASLNNTLEQNPVPTLWTVNAVTEIDVAYRRRSDFSISFTNPPDHVRRTMFADCFAGLPLSVAVQHELAGASTLTPGQIARAARTARIAAVSNDGLEAFVRRGIERSTELLGLGADSTRED